MQSVIVAQGQDINFPGTREDCTEDSALEERERNDWQGQGERSSMKREQHVQSSGGLRDHGVVC